MGIVGAVPSRFLEIIKNQTGHDMGDKSPKANQKKSSQKNAAASSADQKKRAAAAAKVTPKKK